MLNYIRIKLGDRDEQVVVLTARLIANGSVVRITFEKIMSNLNYFGAVKENGMDIKIDTPADIDPANALPFLSIGTSMGLEQDLTFVYNWLNANPQVKQNEDVLNGLVGKIVGQGYKIDLDDIKSFIVAMDTLAAYIKGELRFQVIDSGTNFNNVARTLPIIKNYNKSQGHMFQHIKDETNVTSFMHRATDRFFLQIPSHNKLMFPDAGTDVDSLVPQYDDIVKPYPHPIYQTPYYANVSRLSQPQLMDRLKVIADEMKLKLQDIERVPEIETNLVKGYPENDTLELQDNELDYYNALNEYVRYDIARAFKDADVEEMFRENKCSPNMLVYLKELVYAALCINWHHTNFIPLNYAQWYYVAPVEEDEDVQTAYWYDFDAAISEDMSVRGPQGQEIKVGRGMMRKYIDGTVGLFKFIEAASETGLGLDAYIQAIVKLFRWGFLKPQALKLGNYDKYFDLNTFSVKSTLGDLSSLQPTKTANGYEYTAKGYVKHAGRYDDAAYLNEKGHPESDLRIPLGLICERALSGGKTQIVFMSFFDVLNHYRNNPEDKFIEGVTVTMDNGTVMFTVNVSEIDFTEHGSLLTLPELVKQSTDREFVFYDSDVVKRILLRFSEGPLSSLAVLAEVLGSTAMLSKNASAMAFKTEDEMYDKMIHVPAAKSVYLKTGMAAAYMPVVLQADQFIRQVIQGDINENNFTLVLNAYSKAASMQGFVDEANQWSDEPVQAPVQQQPANNGITQMSQFGGSSQAAATASATATAVPVAAPVTTPPVAAPVASAELTLDSVKDFLRGYFIRPIEKEKIAFKIVVDDKVHGYIQMVNIQGKDRVVLASPIDVPEDISANANITALNIAFLYQLLASSLAGLLEEVDRGNFLYFSSAQSSVYYRQYFNQMWKTLSAPKQ